MSANDRREFWQALSDAAWSVWLAEKPYTRRWRLALNVWADLYLLAEGPWPV
jgi:hypothetical protein